jgi:hypothetical protein
MMIQDIRDEVDNALGMGSWQEFLHALIDVRSPRGLDIFVSPQSAPFMYQRRQKRARDKCLDCVGHCRLTLQATLPLRLGTYTKPPSANRTAV